MSKLSGRVRLRFAIGVAAWLLVLAGASDAPAQFNPGGRTRSKPKASRRAAPSIKPTKEPTSAALIARYSAIVLRQPSAEFPLQRLCDLYRQRDGNLDQLIDDFEARAKAGSRAALIALGGIYHQARQLDRALDAYERAIVDQADDPVALLGLARLREEQGDKLAAVERYAQALEHLKPGPQAEQTLRTLVGLYLDLGRWDEAKAYHSRLVESAKGSFFVRAELARELMARGEHARAAAEYEQVIAKMKGDRRVLAPLISDYGKALAKTGRTEEALKQLRRALRLAQNAPGLRREIYQTLAEIYRANHRLPELITEIEAEPSPDPQRLVLLGGLYEETGQLDKALKTYRQALVRNAQDVDTRLKVVRLLEIAGRLEEAIEQERALVRTAPHNPDYAFRLAESLIQRGDRTQALRQLRTLEARNNDDEDVLAALVDFYERVEEKQRALELLKRLTTRGSRDPRHLIELGSRFWRDGDKDRALRTWKRVESIISDRAQAAHTLGEVYLEHDLPSEALSALEKAHKLAPGESKYTRTLALALERTASATSSRTEQKERQQRAIDLWEALLDDSASPVQLRREARQRIVALWRGQGELVRRQKHLVSRFRRTPPDLEAGRLLGEVQLKLRQYGGAEKTLRQVVAHAPGDVESLLRLERVLALQGKHRGALEVLERLVTADPKRSRDYYERMVRHAAELYEDELAIKYALRVVQLSPEDAEGYRRLGEMYLRRQQTARAVEAFRNAISRNDRLFSVHFELAELLVDQGKVDEADQLLRRIVRASPDDSLVTQAARLSMQINVSRGQLETLERELLPIALSNPTKPIYRRLLVDLYSAMAFPLVQAAHAKDLERAKAAREKLSSIGERAVKPLLDALGDTRDTQQGVAVELLGHIKNRSAGPALLAYATGPGDATLRTRAMVAVGGLADPELLPQLTELVLPGGQPRSDESDTVVVAAAWSIARIDSRLAVAPLTRMLDSHAPSIRALAVLGLARHKGGATVRRLVQLAEDPAAGSLPRAAAAFALGRLGARSAEESLARLTSARDELLGAHALLALSRAHSDIAPQVIAEALFGTSSVIQRAAVEAAIVWVNGQYSQVDPFAVPAGRVDVHSMLAVFDPMQSTVDERARALIQLLPAIKSASVAAVQSSPDRARIVADMLLSRGGEPAFGLFTRDLAQTNSELRGQAEHAAQAIAASVTEPFVALCHHPSADVRARAVRFLATRDEQSVLKSVSDALMDRDPSVVEAALSSLRPVHLPKARAKVVDLLAHGLGWSLRVRAAEAMGRLAETGIDSEAVGALAGAAENDEFSLVREAALRAIARAAPGAAKPLLRRAAARDPEPRVRQTARSLLR